MLENIKSKGKTRNLYIPTSLLDKIDDIFMKGINKIDTEHGNLFVSQQKQNLGKLLTYLGIYSVFNVVKKKVVGIEFNFYDLRHTYITQLIESMVLI